ncbi:MAG: redoxin domain-containing protein [Flavobacteriales bacterium]|nr:redoxin domain-containing protein [Flavobacteriales bacterium]
MKRQPASFLGFLAFSVGLSAQPSLLPSIGIGSLPADGDPICNLPVQTPPIASCGRPEGEQAADFTLYDLDGNAFNLEAALLAGKPVLMVSSSYTCPVFRNKVPRINAVAAQYADQLTTIVVYTPEAHPDVDISPYFGAVNTGQANIDAGILYEQPDTYGERKAILQDMLADMTIDVPVYLDGPCNEWWDYYGPQPNNAYLIDLNGTIHTHHDWFDKLPENIDCDIADLLGIAPPPACNGQTFGGQFSMEWVSNDTVHGIGGTTLTAHMRLSNTSATEDVLVRVVKLQNQLPAGWGSSLCLDVCYLPDVDTAIVPIAAGEIMEFYYYFYSTPGSATGYTRIGLRNEIDNSNNFTREVWGMAEGGVGMAESSPVERSLPYPQPCATDFVMPAARAGDRIVLCDPRGTIVLEASAWPKVDVSGLRSGLYMATLLRNGADVASAKVLVEH